MSETQIQDFQKRVGAISREHRKLSRGYVELVERDGLLVPKRARHARRNFPVKPILLMFIGFIALKGFMYQQVGAINYNDRVSILESGNAAEKAGAWMMAADPLTVWLSDQIATFF